MCKLQLSRQPGVQVAEAATSVNYEEHHMVDHACMLLLNTESMLSPWPVKTDIPSIFHNQSTAWPRQLHWQNTRPQSAKMHPYGRWRAGCPVLTACVVLA